MAGAATYTGVNDDSRCSSRQGRRRTQTAGACLGSLGMVCVVAASRGPTAMVAESFLRKEIAPALSLVQRPTIRLAN